MREDLHIHDRIDIECLNSLAWFSMKVRDKFEDSIIFRGQAKGDGWPLIPKTFRTEEDHRAEKARVSLFKEQAVSRMERPPDLKDDESWLLLMQHYQAPTRLLDWTRSPLIALYFAVCDPKFDEDDGIIWACAIDGVNKMNKDSGDRIADRLLRSVWTQEKLPEVTAMRGIQIDPRLRAQQACFTIHGDEHPFEELDGVDQCLRWVSVPAEEKASLRLLLHDCGIHEHDLFPDLSKLAEYVQSLSVPPRAPVSIDERKRKKWFLKLLSTHRRGPKVAAAEGVQMGRPSSSQTSSTVES